MINTKRIQLFKNGAEIEFGREYIMHGHFAVQNYTQFKISQIITMENLKTGYYLY